MQHQARFAIWNVNRVFECTLHLEAKDPDKEGEQPRPEEVVHGTRILVEEVVQRPYPRCRPCPSRRSIFGHQP